MSTLLLNLLRISLGRTLRKEPLKCNHRLLLSVSSIKYCTKPEAGKENKNKKKTKEIPKVTLIQQNDLSVTTLEEAQKLARRRGLQLIKVQDLDPKSQRAIYKLATTAELLADDFEESKKEKITSSSKKTCKSVTIGCRIAENDLASRLKNISKWLTKENEVRVLIQGGADDGKSSEKIFQKIETAIKEPEIIGKVTQKRSNDGFIKFNILPAGKKESKDPKA